MTKLPNLVQLIKENIQEELDNEFRSPRYPGTYRGSELGDCARAIQYSVLNSKREQINPQLGLLFRDGHLHHDDLRNLLSRVGSVTNVEQGAAKKYQVSLQSTPIEYQIVITVTPDLIFDRDYIVDIKTINRFSFKYLSKDWLRLNKKEYIVQVNTYMNVFQKEYACLLFKCKDTSELSQFWYRYDPDLMDLTLKKLAMISFAVDSGKMIKRPYRRTSRECKYCPFAKTCWRSG